jgi:hypothetical protein
MVEPSTDEPFNLRVHTLGAHFQATPTPQAHFVELRLQNPMVLAGAISVHDFRGLLTAWLEGNGGLLHQYMVEPPSVLQNLEWRQDVQVAPDYFPLIDQLPPWPSTFREARLSGGGVSFEQSYRDWLQTIRFQIAPQRSHPVTFARDYLGMQWGMDAPYLLIHLPLALAMSTEYDAANQKLLVDLHFRPPLSVRDLEVRIGSGLFNASLPTRVPASIGRDDFGWDLGRVEHHAPAGSALKVWLSRIGMGVDFGWELTVDLGRPNSPGLIRERFLPRWYTYGFQNLAAEVELRMPGDKGSRPADAFELAIANVCGALGFGVLFAGHMLKSQGVDLVAFDERSHRLYVISATIGNSIGEKLRSLVNLLPDIDKHVTPGWEVRPVIVTTQAELIAEDLKACHERGVLVLHDIQLAPLKEAPPDLEAFAALLASDPTQR